MGLLAALGLQPPSAPALVALPGRIGALGALFVSFDAGDDSADAVPSADGLQFSIERGRLGGLIARLELHAQHTQIAKPIAQAKALAGQADTQAVAGNWAPALQLVANAIAVCDAAAVLADRHAAYARKRGSVANQILSVKGLVDATTMATAVQQAAAADTRRLVGTLADVERAITLLDEPLVLLGRRFSEELRDLEANVKRLDALPQKAKDFAAADIGQARALVAGARQAHGAGQWSRCLMAAAAARALLGPTLRLAERRGRYDTARAQAQKSLDAVRATPALKDPLAGLEARLILADSQASLASRRFEDGVLALEALGVDAQRWLALAGVIATHANERSAADKALAALDAHPAAARIEPQRKAARAALVAAAATARLGRAGPRPEQDWPAALAAVRAARTELAAAAALAEGLAPVLAARKAATTQATDPAALRGALKGLRERADALAQRDTDGRAEAALKQFKSRADKVAAALTGNDLKAAAAALPPAAESLAAATSLVLDHERFKAALAASEARLATLAARPGAAALKPKLTALRQALAEARAQDKQRAAEAALQALQRADALATEADRADTERQRFDQAAGDQAKRIDALTDRGLQTEMRNRLAQARAQADMFRFDLADKALKDLELRLDTQRVTALTRAGSGGPDLAAAAAKMAEHGGTKALDALLKTLPDKVDPAVVSALAQGRFGIAFETDPNAAPAGEVQAVKAICRMLAKAPRDLRIAAGVQRIVHAPVVAATNGGKEEGHYNLETASLTLRGQPAERQQRFGAQLVTKDEAGNRFAQLPERIAPAARPVDDKPVDKLSWTLWHELGHGIDDAAGHMRQHGQQPDHGGWRVYGTDVKPIADAAGAHFGLNSSAEERQYVLDRLMNVTPAEPPPGPGNWAQRKERFDLWIELVTTPGIYQLHAACVAVKIPVGGVDLVFHEADPREWVSYRLDARDQGLTGYQFHSPGEWFAELYAGYRTGKLGPRHPALAFLRKLAP